MSETDFLKLKKHDNVETNTEKFDIENYLNGNWDKINENAKKVNTDISNINSKNKEQDTNIEQLQENTETSSNKIAELEKELKEAQEDFYQNSIRGQASGEYIHVEDSSNCRSIIGIGGNHEQETRSGKNLLLNDTDKGTVNGITFTKDSKGIIKANGTATDAIVVYLGSKFTTIAAGTYKLSDGRNDESKDTFFTYVDCYNTDGSAYATGNLISTSDGSVKTYTESKLIKGRIVVRKGVTLNNIVFKPQLELIKNASGSETEYEEYGASPSPDYPSEVQTVGSNVNIFDKDNPDMFLNGLTPDNSGNIVSTLTDTTKTNYIITIIVPCKGNKQYTISRWLSGKTFIVYESEKNKFNINDKVTLLKRNDNSGIINETIATSANAKYILVKIYSTWGNEENTYNDLISSIKIEKGKVATSYSKYGQGCVKVTKCNKNIFKPEEFSIINQNVTCSYKDGKFTLNGEVTSAFTIDISKHFDFNKIAQLTVNKNVTFSIQKYTGNIDFELNLGSRSSFYILQLRSLKKTKITKNLLEELTRFSLYVGVGKYNNFSFELQLEIGDNQTVSVGPAEQSYIMPTQQSMKSIEDIRDTFIKKDGKWYERHNINRRIFDGTTNKFVRTSGTANNLFVTNTFEDGNIIVPSTYGENVQHFNNYFQTNYSSDGLFANGQYVGSAIRPTDDMVMGFGKESEINTVDKANAWLKAKYDAGAPLYVDYLLETPIDIECTEEQSKILDELNNARTYKNVTNITTDSKAILSLDYAKDLETLLNNTQALAVNNASEGV